MRTRPLAIVMGRNYTSRLGMIRAAGMAGCDVIVIQTDNKRSKLGTIDDKSKYVIRSIYAQEPSRQLLIESIQSCKRQQDAKPILLPTDDYTAATIDMYLETLRNDFFLPNVHGEQGAVVRLMDKSFQKRIAKETGLKVAKEWICKWENGSYLIPEDITYPCFTKPQLSSQGHLKSYQKKCNGRKELEAVLMSVASFFHGPILVEEYHDISREYAVVGLSLEKQAIMPSIIQMNTSYHGITATGSLLPITSVPSLKEQLSTFMQMTGLVGLFDIDLYESNGEVYFNELNVRFGANGFALTYSHANLPGLYIEWVLHHAINELPSALSRPLTFSNENILRQMYLEGLLSWSAYQTSCKEGDQHAICHPEDIVPYKLFTRTNLILPLWKILKQLKKRLS